MNTQFAMDKMRKIGEKTQKISESFKRLLPVSAVALAASAALHAGNAQAILVFEFLEEGSDVRLNISGSLTGLPGPEGAFIDPLDPPSSIRTGGFSFFIKALEAGAPNAFATYSIGGPNNIGTNVNNFSLSNYIGTNVFINRFDLALLPGYVEGDAISGTGLILGQTLSSLGLNSTTPGDLLGTWTIGSDSIQARIGSAGGGAAVPGPLPLFGAAAAFAHSRRLRARLRAGSSPQA